LIKEEGNANDLCYHRASKTATTTFAVVDRQNKQRRREGEKEEEIHRERNIGT